MMNLKVLKNVMIGIYLISGFGILITLIALIFGLSLEILNKYYLIPIILSIVNMLSMVVIIIVVCVQVFYKPEPKKYQPINNID